MPPEGASTRSIDDLIRRLRWPVLRRLAVHPGGDERSAVRGPGIEYNEVREYQPGDDPRLIDWNLTARSNTTYVLPMDIAEVAPEVLRHRLVLSYEGIASGVSPEAIIATLLERYAPPRIDLGDKVAT